jgi:hypothetical protein
VWVKSAGNPADQEEDSVQLPFAISSSTGTGGDTTRPTVSINGPTSTTTFSTSASSLSLNGAAADNRGVTQVTWSNNRGGSGTANGTTSWTTAAIPLQTGTNVITITARDAAGNTGADSLTVTRGTGSTPSGPIQVSSVSADKVAPQPAGTTIVLTANVTGGTGSYLYKWTLYDGQNWTMVQNWTSSNRLTWRPTSRNSAYRFALWVKNANNPNDTYEALGNISFPIQ